MNKILKFFEDHLVLTLVLFFLYMCAVVWAADTALVDMAADTSLGMDSIFYTVDDPAGTPADRKVTMQEVSDTVKADITSMDVKFDASTAAGHPLNSDDTYSGMPLTGINAGEAISQWDMVYYDTTATEWLIADADASGEAPAWGIAVSAGTDGNALDVLQKGFVRNDAWTWTPGAQIFLDDTTPGGLTETAPSTSTDIVQPVGVAYTADIIWINVDPVFNYTRVQ